MNIEIIKSKRKTIALQVIDSETVRVRAPYRVSKKFIQEFVEKNNEWILRKLQEAKEKEARASEVRPLSDIEIEELAKRAREVFVRKVEHFAPLVGVDWNKVTIRKQKTRWGSCSDKGNLSFNVALMRAPIEVLDYVVVHELCHRIELNHSKKFWSEVERVFPDYRECEKWLKKNGRALMTEIHGDRS